MLKQNIIKSGGDGHNPSGAVTMGGPSRHLLPQVFLAALLFLGGCQTAPQNLFTAAGPGWRVQQGQALWRPQRGAPEFGGDLVLARDDAGRCLIQFDKTPLALVAAQITPAHWLIRFPQEQLRFTDRGAAAATRFTWLFLPAALAGEKLPDPVHFEHKPDGGWQLQNSQTGETIEGFLAP